jgi:hypothetical protein
VPQLVRDIDARQVVAKQQLVHEVPSQTHWPAKQCWPAAHGDCVPQEQPFAPHRSAAVGLQAAQAMPPIPHAAMVVSFTQLPVASQQPLGQLDWQGTPESGGLPASNISNLLSRQPASRASRGRAAAWNRAMGVFSVRAHRPRQRDPKLKRRRRDTFITHARTIIHLILEGFCDK